MSIPVEHIVAILSVSTAHAAATTALVLGIAGMMFFTTPCVCVYVTPGMSKVSARCAAASNTQRRCSGSSASNASSGRSLGHRINLAYSTQCAAFLGVSANVHRGKFCCGGKSHIVHSKQGVTPGKMTLAWPLNPSVPPSTIGLIVD